jgi:hypothetical protein
MRYFNAQLIEMKRAIPMPYAETVLDRVIKRCQVIWESENIAPSAPPKAKPNWRLVKLLVERGATQEQARELARENAPPYKRTKAQDGYLFRK